MTASNDRFAGMLAGLRDAYRQRLEEDDSGAASAVRRSLIRFKLGGEAFAVDGGACREILRLPRLLPIPRLPGHIAGIFNLRGEIVAVTDLRPLLGLPAAPAADRPQVIVVSAGDYETALLTDGGCDMLEIDPQTIEAPGSTLNSFAADIVCGRAADPRGGILLLDVARLGARPELRCRG